MPISSAMGGDGWGKVGTALGLAMSGQNGDESKVYQDTMLRGHRVQKALMDAQQATQKYNAAAAFDITPALPPGMEEMAPMLNNAFRANQNPTGVLRGIGEQMKNNAMSRAVQAGADGDFEAMQTNMSLATGKAPERTKISGSTMFNPALSPQDQRAIITPYGEQYIQSGDTRSRERATIAAGSRERIAAAKPSAAMGGSDPAAKEYQRMLMDAAQGALSDAKSRDLDVTGLSVKDVAWQLENHGEFKDRDGTVVARWNVDKALPEGGAAPAAAAPAKVAPPANYAPPAGYENPMGASDWIPVEEAVGGPSLPSTAMSPGKLPSKNPLPKPIAGASTGGRETKIYEVSNKAEAAAALKKMKKGDGIQFPNGVIQYKD